MDQNLSTAPDVDGVAPASATGYVPDQQVRPAASLAPPTPHTGSATQLSPVKPTEISPRMRDMLGRACFRDVSDQVQLEQIRGVLLTELSAQRFLQVKVVDRIAALFIEIEQYRRSIQTLVWARRLHAARMLLMPEYGDFYPPPHNATISNGTVFTVYGLFMQRAEGLLAMSAEQTIAKASDFLAEQGLPAELLDEHARILAMADTERFEKIIAGKSAEVEALIEQAFRLKDRLERKAQAAAAVTSKKAA